MRDWEISIGTRKIGQNRSPFIIAEMSGNHNQSLERALSIIRTAAKCGADAIKIQTYTPDTLTINHTGGLFSISDPKSIWHGRTLYELYQEAHTPWEWHKAMFDEARRHNILIFSTPFDETSVDFLENLQAPAYKIASFENNHLPLLKKVARTGKPVIMSTGLSDLKGIEEAVQCLRQNGVGELILLKCTSTYPADPQNSNILTIPHMSDLFQCPVGLSDHTIGIGVPLASIALGARVIEKHFTLDRSEGGVDSTFSLEPQELSLLVEESKRAFLSLGGVVYGIQEEEQKSLLFKRSIYVVKDIAQGDVITSKHIRIIRPGDGLAPKYIDVVIGKRVSRDITRGTPLSWNHLLKS